MCLSGVPGWSCYLAFAESSQQRGREEDQGGYHFFDMNAKVNHSFSDRTRGYMSFYMGSDSYLNGEEKDEEDRVGKDFRWRWGNLIGSAGISHVFSNKLFATFTAGYTRYRSHIQQDKEGYTLSPNRKDRQLFSQENHYRSAMEDVSLRASFDYRLHEKHRLKFGETIFSIISVRSRIR